ncbi:uncharacterized protein LOC117335215 [Pecten maximus]|uniref:uncharacterized protein LOC117335215 n=1 Tax=Pecten maximus TaxID=6579 RepID=UPI00145804CF|nr:uncharacterized protein LOC117335215 [Pecten maximus]
MLAGKYTEGDDVYSEPYSQLAPVQTATQPTSTSGSLEQPKRNSQTRRAYRKGTKDRVENGGKLYSEARCLHDDMGNSYSEPVGVYSPSSGQMTAGEFTPVNSGLPERDVTHEHEVVSYDLAKSPEEVPPKQQIQLGDYTEPPDRKKDSVGGIRRPKPEEYSDPYDVDRLLQAGSEQKKLAQKLRHSAPAKGSEDDLYELAQPIPNTGNSPSKGINTVTTKKVLLYRAQSEGFTYDHVPNITGTSFDSGVETGAETGFEIPESELEQDDYDHLSTWKGGSNPSSPLKSPDYTHSQTLVVGEKVESPKMNTVSSAFSTGGAPMASPKPPVGRVEEVYAGAYEEPWDSKRSQQQFSKIVGKAESKYPDSTDDRIIPGVVVRPKVQTPEAAVYEDAWDTEEKQKQFENKVKEAQRKQSSGALQSQKGDDNTSAPNYDEPWTDINCMRTPQPPMSLPGQPKVRVSSSPNTAHRPPHALPPMNNPAHRPHQNLPGSSCASAPVESESNTYESPWDTKKKEQELEDKVNRLKHSSPVNQRTVVDTPPLSPGSPPNFYPPPPPTSQMYEEAWDMKRPSHLLAKAQSEGQRNSPSQNRMSEGPGRERAEPIDSGLPLDIQKFYHGSITRKEAEELMRIHKEGSYLVRRSETQKNVFSLSIKGIRGMPMHIRIGLSQGEYILGENSQPFPTVPEVIDYYTRHELPVQNAGRLRLLYPIMRNKHTN